MTPSLRLFSAWFFFLGSAAAMGDPRLIYSSLETEAATEYQVKESQFGPSYLRLMGRAELGLTDDLTAKALVNPCLGPYGQQPKGVTQCSVSRLIEELTLAGIGEKGDFSIGRQVITQGNSEGFFLLDRFNGRDYCRLARLDIQNKLPNWLARGKTFLNQGTTLGVTFAPFSANSQLPAPGSYCEDQFNAPGQFAALHDPKNDSLAAWAGGTELAFTQGNWSVALNAMTTREDYFVLETVPTPQKVRPRTLWLGGTGSATLGGIVVRGELAYSPARDFTLTPQALGGVLQQGGATNGMSQRQDLMVVIGLEGRRDEFFWALQYYNERLSNGPAVVRNLDARMASLRVRQTFANDSIAFDGFGVLELDHGDLALRATLSYDINADTTVTVGGTGYADYGATPGFFGSYAGRESVFFKLRRTLF